MAATLFGRQEPTKRVCPEYDETHGGKAAKLVSLAGLNLMPWQRGLIDDWMCRTPSGTWAAPNCGASVPRQNGKTCDIACRIAAGMVLYGEWCVYTSHLQKTSTETFEELRTLFESKALSKYVKDIKAALGREEIVLTNGGRCKFLARTRNGGRGQHGDLWVCDEAQELTDEQQGSFLPILAASRNPQTIYIGTPPDENAPGEVFTRIRRDALSGNTTKTAWSEWSVDDIGDVSDRSRWAECNPSMGYRIKDTTIDAEFEQMAPDKFARERLGWWTPNTSSAVISATAWEDCKTDDPPMDGLTCYAVKFSPDGSIGTIAACVKPDDGVPYVEVIENRSMAAGIGFFCDFIVPRWKDAAQVVVDGMANAQPLIDRLRGSGVPERVIVKPRSNDMSAACSTLLNAVNERNVSHMGQKALDESATNSGKRPIGTGGGWGFKSNQNADSTLIEACALAYWAAVNTKRNPSRKGRIG